MEIKNIASAFVKAKRDFAPALKSSINPHFKNRYADLAACVEAVDDSFLKNGIVMYQETFEDTAGVTVETVLLHESGEMLRCGKLHVPAAKNDPQGYGSALSYARRYSLMAACGIAPEDDDGNAASRAPAKSETVLLLTEKQVADIEAMADESNVPVAKIYGAAKVGSLGEIPASAYGSIIKKLKASIIVAETSKEHQA